MGIHEENVKQLKTMRKNLKRLREDKRWSVEELSEVSGIDRQELINMESGENFDVQSLFQLCHVYDIKPYKIFLPADIGTK